MNHAVIRPYFFAFLIVFAAVLTFQLLQPFLVTIALAGVFSVILYPLYGGLKRTLRLPPGGTALITLITGVLLLAVPLALISSRIVSEVQGLYVTLSQPGSLSQLELGMLGAAERIDAFLPGSTPFASSMVLDLDVYAQQAAQWAQSHAAGAFSGTLQFIALLIVFLMTVYYFLKEGPRLRKTVVKLSPLVPAETQYLMERLSRTINSVVRGNITIALIQGVLVATGFTIFGIPNGIMWGAVASISALIPSIGTGLVVIPGVLYLLFTGATVPAIGLALWSFVIVGMVDNLLAPQLIGRRAAIHPLLILLSVLGGLAYFGPEGLFLGPLVVSLLIGLLSIYSPADPEGKPAPDKASV